MNLFENTSIRSVWDNTSKKYWFSVIDVCAALTDSDYTKSRNYWKWLKRKLISQGNPLVSVTNQLKFEALDGKLRYTDVMDAEEILQLIQVFPSPKAEAFKTWIAQLAVAGENIVECVAKAARNVKDKIKHRVGNMLQTIRKREIHIHAEERQNKPDLSAVLVMPTIAFEVYEARAS